MSCRKARPLAIVVIMVVFWNASILELLAQGPVDLRVIPLEEENRGQAVRDVRVQVQDLSRGPLAGAEVTFTTPDGGGVFSNGSRTVTVATDRQGVAVASGFRPQDANARVQISVSARYMEQRASITMLSGAVTAPKGSRKWPAVLLTIGGAAALVAILVSRRSSGSPGTSTTDISLTPGAPTVGGP